jgi:hypothetical protein
MLDILLAQSIRAGYPRTRGETNHAPPSSSEVNAWSYICIPYTSSLREQYAIFCTINCLYVYCHVSGVP